jgi:hypothetical protein
MYNNIEKIIEILTSYQFSLTSEKRLQVEIEEIFLNEGINFIKEYSLGNLGIIDFIVEDIGIEVKVKGNPKSIYRQCEDYCQHDDIKKLLLVTNKSMGMPEEINNKLIFVVNLGLAHL